MKEYASRITSEFMKRPKKQIIEDPQISEEVLINYNDYIQRKLGIKVKEPEIEEKVYTYNK
jgi:hypothetical protein